MKYRPWTADYKPPAPPDENSNVKKTPEEIEREIKVQNANYLLIFFSSNFDNVIHLSISLNFAMERILYTPLKIARWENTPPFYTPLYTSMKALFISKEVFLFVGLSALETYIQF